MGRIYILNGNSAKILLIVKLIKKMSYFRKSYDNSKKEIKVKLDLSSYATKPDLKKCSSS